MRYNHGKMSTCDMYRAFFISVNPHHIYSIRAKKTTKNNKKVNLDRRRRASYGAGTHCLFATFDEHKSIGLKYGLL